MIEILLGEKEENMSEWTQKLTDRFCFPRVYINTFIIIKQNLNNYIENV
jgi:hypothetical protein